MSSVIRFMTAKEKTMCIENSMYDYLDKIDVTFEFGKSYAFVGDFGTGGYGISRILSGNVEISNFRNNYYGLTDLFASSLLRKSMQADYSVLVDGIESVDYLSENGWFVGQSLFSRITGREKKISSILNDLKENPFYSDIVDYFDVSKGMGPRVSDLIHEKWRVSTAIGLLLEKQLFCYPYMNSRFLYDVFYSSGNALSVKKCTELGRIVIIPTNDIELVSPIVDEVIVLQNRKFENLEQYITEHIKRLGI